MPRRFTARQIRDGLDRTMPRTPITAMEAEYRDGLIWVIDANGKAVGIYRTWQEAEERMNRDS